VLWVLFAVVRVRLALRRGDRLVGTVALASSGYEAETPQVLVSRAVADILGCDSSIWILKLFCFRQLVVFYMSGWF